MREIVIDLSQNNSSFPLLFGGYEGEHKNTKLSIILPSDLLPANIEKEIRYKFVFQTPIGELISSPYISADEITDNKISTILWGQLLKHRGDLIGCVAAVADLSGEEVELIAKTSSFKLKISDSPTGVDIVADTAENRDFISEVTKSYLDTVLNLFVDKDYVDTKLEEALGEHDAFSNALKGSASGAIVSIGDVSPVEHTMNVRLTRKNLFNNDTSKIASFSYISDSGALIDRWGYEIHLPVGTYTGSVSFIGETSSEYIYGLIRDVNGATVSKPHLVVSTDTYSPTFTINEGDVLYFYDGVYDANDPEGSLTRTKGLFSRLNIQIEEGTVATEYAPYIEDISSVTLGRYGKNLCATTNYSRGSLSNGNIVSGTGGFCITTDYIPVTQGTYIISYTKGATGIDGAHLRNVAHYDKDKVFVKNEWTSRANNYKFTVDENTAFIRFDAERSGLDGALGGSYPIINHDTFYTDYKFQVELNDTATEYEPYIEPTEYSVNEDGTVNGVVSRYPTTTLVPDTSGVIVHCIYNKDINKVPVSGGVPTELTAKVNQNTSDILTHSNLIDENRKSIANLQGYLGYDDKDILGLEADFESNTFTRLAGAKGLNAGADFNQFSMYRDRVRCNVADDGTINALYGETGESEWITILETCTIDFGKMGDDTAPDSVGGSGSGSSSFATVPHPTDIGNSIKLHVKNNATGESYVFNSTLGVNCGDPSVAYEYGTFISSNGDEVRLLGWPNGERNGDSMAYYDGGFQFFIYPYCTDTLDISVELERKGGYQESGSNGQVMVYQPKFYYRMVPLELEKQDGGFGYHIKKANYYISATPKAGFKLHPAFYDKNGNPVEYILYSAYEGYGNEEVLHSIAGVTPSIVVREEGESYASTRGDGWHIETIQALSANQVLMAIEYGGFNLQEAMGRGVVDVDALVTTGATSSLGNSSGMAEGTNGKVSISYRGIENVWGNCWTWCQGVTIWGDGSMLGGQPYIRKGFDFEETSVTLDSFDCTGFTIANSSGLINRFGYGKEAFDWLFLPSKTEGGTALPVGDYAWVSPDLKVEEEGTPLMGLRVGGYHSSGDSAGGFEYDSSIPYYASGAGCRLMYIPQMPFQIV